MVREGTPPHQPLPTACPPGFFKVSPRRPLCSPCPEHSLALENASTFCVCQDTYARSPTDPPSASCTRECPLLAGGGVGVRRGWGSWTGRAKREAWGGSGHPGLGLGEPRRMDMGVKILCEWPSPHSPRLSLGLAGTSLLSSLPPVPGDHVPILIPSMVPMSSSQFLAARPSPPRAHQGLPAPIPLPMQGCPRPCAPPPVSPCPARLRPLPVPLSATPCRRAAVRATGPAVQPEPLPPGAAAALAAACRLRRPFRRHLLAAVPALRPRRPGGRMPTLRATCGLRPAPGRAAGTRRHAAAPAAGRALHRARGRAQRRLRPGSCRGSHLRAGHRVHRTRG